MPKRIVVIQGHPDASQRHLLHAMADAYADAARAAGHEVRRIEVAQLDFPLLRTQADFEQGDAPGSLTPALVDLKWAEHWVVVFPLWLGTMPALLKGFLEQVFRPGFAMAYQEKGFPKKLLAGRSARLVVTMGMPPIVFRWFYGAHGLRGLKRNILNFAGITPVRESLYGLAAADAGRRAQWLAQMRDHGTRGA